MKEEKNTTNKVNANFWVVIEKRGQVFHNIKWYKRKSDAVNLLIKLRLKSLTEFHLVSISNANQILPR